MPVIDCTDLFLAKQANRVNDRYAKMLDMLCDMPARELANLCCQLRHNTYKGDTFTREDIGMLERILDDACSI